MPYVQELAENLDVEQDNIVAACDPQTIIVVDDCEEERSFVADFLLDSNNRRNLHSKIADFARYDIYSGFEADSRPRHWWRKPGENAIDLTTWRHLVTDGYPASDVWRAVVARCVNEQVGFSACEFLDTWENAAHSIGDNRVPGNGTIDRLMAQQARGWVGDRRHVYEFFNPVLIVFDMLQIRHLSRPEQENMLSSLADATFWAIKTHNVRVKVFVTPEIVEIFEGAMQALFKEQHLWWLDGMFVVRLSE